MAVKEFVYLIQNHADLNKLSVQLSHHQISSIILNCWNIRMFASRHFYNIRVRVGAPVVLDVCNLYIQISTAAAHVLSST
jgi:hypothetical protein